MLLYCPEFREQVGSPAGTLEGIAAGQTVVTRLSFSFVVLTLRCHGVDRLGFGVPSLRVVGELGASCGVSRGT